MTLALPWLGHCRSKPTELDHREPMCFFCMDRTYLFSGCHSGCEREETTKDRGELWVARRGQG